VAGLVGNPLTAKGKGTREGSPHPRRTPAAATSPGRVERTARWPGTPVTHASASRSTWWVVQGPIDHPSYCLANPRSTVALCMR